MTGTVTLGGGEVDQYVCLGNDLYQSHEVIYSFVAPGNGTAAAILVNNPGEQVIAVLENTGQGCDANTCVGGNDTAVSFPIISGETYFISIDAPTNTTNPNYSLQLNCNL